MGLLSESKHWKLLHWVSPFKPKYIDLQIILEDGEAIFSMDSPENC